MKKRLLSYVLTICMVLALMPRTAHAVIDADILIGTTGYDTLQAAVNAVEEGQTIRMMRGITLTDTVTIADTNNKSFVIELNGKTLNSGIGTAILHEGSGTLSIKDSLIDGGGKITGTKRVAGSDVSGMIFLNGGSLVVESGIVENTGTTGNENAIYVSSGSVTVNGGVVRSVSDASYSIYNAGSGNVIVTGGTVQNDNGANSHAIRSGGTGSVIVSGGIVMGVKGFAIGQISSGDVIVSGGRVEGKRIAISNTANTGKITISGTPIIRSDSDEYTIRVENVLEITGGTIENANVSGTAIYGSAVATSILISSGSAIIKGGDMAMNKAPDLSSYNNVLVTASTDVSGTPTAVYNAGDITTYKYLKFEPGPVTVPGAPTIGTATAGNGQATITFSAPDSDGGAEITSYTVASSPGGITGTGATGPITLTGLTNGTAYTFAVTATNGVGTSIASAESNSITPTLPKSGGGGGVSSTPTLITKIDSGNSLTGTNLERLVKEGKTLTVEGEAGKKLVFDTEALKNIGGQTNDSLKLEIKDVSADHESKHPGKLVVSLTATAGGKKISNFGRGTATISLPYVLKPGEKAEDVTVWYLAEDGTMSEVPCSYDPKTQMATFTVNHFSLYLVGTDALRSWVNPFSDVKESSWYYEAVRFVSANKLMQGTTDTAFDPKGKTTRGMIVTTLWRMENQPKAAKTITFNDVKSGKYYHDAVAWASEKGIVSGYSADKFGPEDKITREQLAVILQNYAASKGYTTGVSAGPTGELPANLSEFSDAGKIHKWGKDAMSWSNVEGLINGTGSDLLDPASAAQRSQVAAILQRFVENTAK